MNTITNLFQNLTNDVVNHIKQIKKIDMTENCIIWPLNTKFDLELAIDDTIDEAHKKKIQDDFYIAFLSLLIAEFLQPLSKLNNCELIGIYRGDITIDPFVPTIHLYALINGDVQ